jgi:DNA helicase IV
LSGRADDIDHEQKYVDTLYERLDGMRERAAQRRAVALKTRGGTLQAQTERDATVALYTEQLAALSAVESGLCFGRLDLEAVSPRYIGRIGIFDDGSDREQLLMDWRAPAARPFYLATAADPQGVRRRRHIRTASRLVVGLDDEVLDLTEAHGREGLTGEAALLAAVGAARTGRMPEIVETIQAEQDRVIRADLGGVLVVQGGPGTGKTAVALHRAAYLLYTHRRELSTRAVLVVGPNATFLRYIGHVLPSLAETGVLLATLGDLYPGVKAVAAEPDAVAAVKGRAVMKDVLAAAVRDRQELPESPIRLVVERQEVVIDADVVRAARDRARRCGRLHNAAREVFAEQVVEALVAQVAAAIGTDPYADDPLGEGDAPGDPMLMGAADLADIRAELAADAGAARALDRLWPPLTPQKLLADLYEAPDRLRAAGLSESEIALLHRADGAAWTPADVPLLDEAAEQLGPVPAAVAAGVEAADRVRRSEIAYAEGALEIARGSASIDTEDEEDPELLLVTDLLDASRLAARQETEMRLTAAERAARDRTWAFGHVIVDEAQELSPMAWGLLMRRCPSRSMTVVGDIAQTGDPAGAASWSDVFAPYVDDRWRLAELTVNYRTPAEVMALASGVLAGIDPAAVPPRSVRATGVPPMMSPLDLPSGLAAALRREVEAVGDGRVAVIAPPDLIPTLAPVVGADLTSPDLEAPVVLLTVRQAKGLEFDAVVVVDPAGIAAESARGPSDLYVALTRPTQRLTVLGALPFA